jgi:hypothetical protein
VCSLFEPRHIYTVQPRDCGSKTGQSIARASRALGLSFDQTTPLWLCRFKGCQVALLVTQPVENDHLVTQFEEPWLT